MRKLLLVTDAWEPQTNGVVTTLQQVTRHLPEFGFEPLVVHPGEFETVPLPSYPEIRIVRNPWKLKDILRRERPDAVHIATEGPLGLYARRVVSRWRIPFTTSLHTKFPEYVHERVRVPLRVGYAFIRWFHRPAVRTLCTTSRSRRSCWAGDCATWSYGAAAWTPSDSGPRQKRLPGKRVRTRAWRGVTGAGGAAAVALRRPHCRREERGGIPRPRPRRRQGDGGRWPQRADLQARYPEAHWLGYRKGQPLIDEYAAADAFVFPSRTDTFGLVMLEALACGTPVAAYPVTGPRDVVQQGVTGWLDDDLGVAVQKALAVRREDCRAYAVTNGWPKIARTLADNLANIDWPVS